MDGIRKYLAELIGTFVLVFFGVGTAIFTDGNLLATALAFGLTVMVMSVTIGRISGCHLNTAISFAMWLDKKLSNKDFAWYVVFQIIGAIIAGALLYCIYGMYADQLNLADWANQGANSVDNVGTAGALLVETVLTFIFVLVVFGATAKNGMDKFAGLYIGLALTMVHLVGINLTGTSVNPARSIGLAIFSDDCLGDLWVFIVAPLIGGILAWAVWKYVFRDADGDTPESA